MHTLTSALSTWCTLPGVPEVLLLLLVASVGRGR